MRIIHTFLCAIYVTFSNGQTLDTVRFSGNSNKHINIVVIGDGYTSLESLTFENDVNTVINGFFDEEPFSAYEDFFNVFSIRTASQDSGADHPHLHEDDDHDGCPELDVNTAYQTTFDTPIIRFPGTPNADTIYIHRLLTVTDPGLVTLYADLGTLFPNYDIVMVIVNDACYGGSGAAGLPVTSMNSFAPQILLHEMAHSFVGLKDEYWPGEVYAAEAPNMTADNNPLTTTWSDWIGSNGIGLFAHDCGGAPECSGWFKPHNNCKMECVTNDFCSVCKEAIIDEIHDLVNPIKGKFPNGLTTLHEAQERTYSVNVIEPSPNSFRIDWYINDVLVHSGQDVSYNLSFDELTEGSNVLRVDVIDTTLCSKSYAPDDGFINQSGWNINAESLCSSYSPAGNGIYFTFYDGCCTSQPTNDDFDWSIITGPTPTSDTGPKVAYVDPLNSLISNDEYAYIEGDQGVGRMAIYESACIDVSMMSDPYFEMRYHMDGADMGELKIYAQYELGTVPKLVHQVSGDVGVLWQRFELDLNPNKGTELVRIFVEGIIGNGNRSDIAIDHLAWLDKCYNNELIQLPTYGDFRSDYHLYSEQYATLTNRVINGIDVNVNVVDSINLDPGFTVDLGAEMTATIKEVCPE